MKQIRVAIGADHKGYQLKESLKQLTQICGITTQWIDVGATSDDRSDYPVFAIKAVQVMKAGKADCAILMCSTGVGMAIAANRYPGIYAALAWSEEIAQLSKEDDNSNILVLPSDYVSEASARTMVCAWLSASFKKGRYAERIAMIDAI